MDSLESHLSLLFRLANEAQNLIGSTQTGTVGGCRSEDKLWEKCRD